MAGVQAPVTSVRIPVELRRALRIRAAEKDRTLTSEIIQRLEKSVNEEAAGNGITAPDPAAADENAALAGGVPEHLGLEGA